MRPDSSILGVSLCAVLTVVLASGCSSGRNDIPTEVSGFALYEDTNLNGVLDAGDSLIVQFDQDLTLGAVAATDFSLPVSGDTLGASPSFALGPGTDQLTITLGTSPAFTARRTFDADETGVGAASAIDIAEGIADGSIVGDEGETARASTPIDIAPGLLDSGQSFPSIAGRRVVTGDFDGDGDQDAFIVAFGEGNQVLLNSGGGVLLDSGQSLGSSPSLDAAVGDFDGDGDLDVAVANDAGAFNQVWENDGTGTFTAGATFGTASSRGVVAGDFDGDGELDLAVGNNGGDVIWFNSGGTFSNGSPFGTLSTRAIATDDFDQDGDLDLVSVYDNGSPRVWRNNGSGSFVTLTELTGPAVSTCVATGDLDLDGFPDIVVGSLDRGVSPFLNIGLSSFSPDPEFRANSVRDVTLGDLDLDGDLDLVIGRSASFFDQVRLNDGTGLFVDSGMQLGALSTYGVELVDFGLDGDLDLITATLNGSARIFSNPLSAAIGAFGLTDSGQDLRNNATPTFNVTLDCLLSDLTGDGALDFLNGATPNGAARLWVNDGTGVFLLGSTFGVTGVSALAVAVGDVTSDGAEDVLVGRDGQATLISRNDGAGLFTAIGSIAASVDATQLRLAQLNAGTDLDLITDDGSTVRVLTGDGTGTFTDTAQSLGGAVPGGIAIGNLDGLGGLDVVLGGASGATLVFTNDGTATFTNSGQSLGTATTRDVALGDLDGDGDLDIFEANDGGNRVWFNDGAGTFTDSLQSLGTDNSRRVALGDLDNDGDLDAIVANEGSASKIWLNDSTGTMGDSGLSLIATGNARAVAVGDLEPDGDLDAVFGTTEGDRVFLND